MDQTTLPDDPYRIVPTRNMTVHEWELVKAQHREQGYAYDPTLVVFAHLVAAPQIDDTTNDEV